MRQQQRQQKCSQRNLLTSTSALVSYVRSTEGGTPGLLQAATTEPGAAQRARYASQPFICSTAQLWLVNWPLTDWSAAD